VPQEDIPDRPAGRVRRQLTHVGKHVVGRHHGPPAQQFEGVVAGLEVAGQHDRHPYPVHREPLRVVQQHLLVAAVGSADQQQHVRPGGSDRPQAGRVKRAGGHVHHLGTGGEGHPVAGLRADQPFLTDHGQPQPAAGRRARQHRGAGRAERGNHRVDAVQHLGWGGGVLGRAEQLTGRRNERALGPRRPDIQAEQVHGSRRDAVICPSNECRLL
jgi:hypothetical protein